ncbi:molybdate ABC transporter permease subunit [Paludifilum halophilum]|uniref:Molybdenum transport system permease n=1 Tax=Paludifilum halophilum TaxID=1642702 RepID=A0A235B5N6_9BACL|nr:molybdate ABC transporter permease subunit [Paludifilum halophilum]OYD06905.1 molybdate ABC transporter permease subunit [Paludifilum halophilum]
MDFSQWISPVLLSLQVTFTASLFAFTAAAAVAWRMSERRFRGKTTLETLLMLPLVLPPTVVGFVLLVVLGRESWFGRLFEWLFHQPVVFTWWAAVIAAAVVAFPLIYQTVKTGFEQVDVAYKEAARVSGADEWRVFLHVTLPLTGRSLLAGYTLGFARGLGEFGATLMVAGNVPGKTQTLPTAIYLAVESGNWVAAAYWTAAIVLLSFGLLGGVRWVHVPR